MCHIAACMLDFLSVHTEPPNTAPLCGVGCAVVVTVSLPTGVMGCLRVALLVREGVTVELVIGTGAKYLHLHVHSLVFVGGLGV